MFLGKITTIDMIMVWWMDKQAVTTKAVTTKFSTLNHKEHKISCLPFSVTFKPHKILRYSSNGTLPLYASQPC